MLEINMRQRKPILLMEDKSSWNNEGIKKKEVLVCHACSLR